VVEEQEEEEEEVEEEAEQKQAEQEDSGSQSVSQSVCFPAFQLAPSQCCMSMQLPTTDAEQS
jgi:CO dehydrogenase/acetyl-CoA synthase beta subunit